MTRVLVVGLDCLVPDVIEPSYRAPMPTVAALAARGIGGVLTSTLPPITVPAWASMLSGRDPGELGVYGFRNRRDYGYGPLVRASARSVRMPRVWDLLTAQGRPSVVVGLPQTSPPPAVAGALVCGFEGPIPADGAFTHPPELATEVSRIVGEYVFDVPDFRNASAAQVVSTVYTMTERRFRLMRHLLASRDWEFAMLHEIGIDRMHHCFWSAHDPAHPRHDPGSPYASAVADYYAYVDDQLAGLLGGIDDDTAVLVASDHGATAMHGGLGVNEILRRAGLLRLTCEPAVGVPLTADIVDWSRTAAWAEGGYYARVFFNVAGREPCGVVREDDVPALRSRLHDLLGTVTLSDGRVLHNRVAAPAELYRRVRGIAPDLLVFFHGEQWRSIGSVGHPDIWMVGNDTGADEANHSRAGMYALTVPGRPPAGRRQASLLDVFPTVCELLGLPVDGDLAGSSLLASWSAAELPVGTGSR